MLDKINSFITTNSNYIIIGIALIAIIAFGVAVIANSKAAKKNKKRK